MKNVVCESTADSRHDLLIAQEGVKLAAIVARDDDRFELGGVGLGPQTLERSSGVRLDDPASRFALGPVLLDEDARGAVENQADHCALRARLFGRVLDINAPALREMDQRTRNAEVERNVLPAPADRRELVAGEVEGRRCDRLECG